MTPRGDLILLIGKPALEDPPIAAVRPFFVRDAKRGDLGWEIKTDSIEIELSEPVMVGETPTLVAEVLASPNARAEVEKNIANTISDQPAP